MDVLCTLDHCHLLCLVCTCRIQGKVFPFAFLLTSFLLRLNSLSLSGLNYSDNWKGHGNRKLDKNRNGRRSRKRADAQEVKGDLGLIKL